MAMAMRDDEILQNINGMMDEEHALLRAAEQEHGLSPEEQARLHDLKTQLDQSRPGAGAPRQHRRELQGLGSDTVVGRG